MLVTQKSKMCEMCEKIHRRNILLLLLRKVYNEWQFSTRNFQSCHSFTRFYAAPIRRLSLGFNIIGGVIGIQLLKKLLFHDLWSEKKIVKIRKEQEVPSVCIWRKKCCNKPISCFD